MNNFSDTLTTTGLVAVIISLLCAAASLLLARYRKQHAPVQAPEAPAPVATPAVAPVREPSTYASASVLFKRLGRAPDNDRPALNHRMVWE